MLRAVTCLIRWCPSSGPAKSQSDSVSVCDEKEQRTDRKLRWPRYWCISFSPVHTLCLCQSLMTLGREERERHVPFDNASSRYRYESKVDWIPRANVPPRGTTIIDRLLLLWHASIHLIDQFVVGIDPLHMFSVITDGDMNHGEFLLDIANFLFHFFVLRMLVFDHNLSRRPESSNCSFTTLNSQSIAMRYSTGEWTNIIETMNFMHRFRSSGRFFEGLWNTSFPFLDFVL